MVSNAEQQRLWQSMLRKADAMKEKGWTQLIDYRDAKENECEFLLSVEGCDLLANSLDALNTWRQMGIRIAALTWNHENCVGTPAVLNQAEPLKPFGKQAALAMRDLGIAVDVSHLNERGFYDLLDMGIVPLASHSCCRALCAHARNLSDRQLRDLFTVGGYVGVNFYPLFLSETGKADLDTVCDHVLHMLSLGGKGHIGFGSDFDGIENKPDGLDGPHCFPALLDALRKKGVEEDVLTGIAGQNLLDYYDRIDPR